jgi:hypothetical protein
MHLLLHIGIVGQHRAVAEQVALNDGHLAVVRLQELQRVDLLGAEFARFLVALLELPSVAVGARAGDLLRELLHQLLWGWRLHGSYLWRDELL